MSALHPIHPTHHLHVVLKLSKLCNLRCTYCFEYEHLADPTRVDRVQLRHLLLNLRDYARSLPSARRIIHLVLHGGEPLLLPPDLLHTLLELRREIFAGESFESVVELQTNLVRLSDPWLATLRDTRVGVGVSYDVAGGARVDVGGRDRYQAVLRNMERLREAQIPFGGISVLHRRNLHRVDAIFDFWYARGIDFRLLPILSFGEAQGSCHGLGLEQHEVLDAMRTLVDRVITSPRRIEVDPVDHHIKTALRYLRDEPGLSYDPARGEWALVVDTDGDAYTYGDSYSPQGHLGNLFAPDAIGEVIGSSAHARTIVARRARMGACETCPYGRACTRLPLGESAPSERVPAPAGSVHSLACPVARPLVDHVLAAIERTPVGRWMTHRARRRRTRCSPGRSAMTCAS